MRSRTSTTAWNLFFHYAAVVLMVISGLVLVPFYLKFIPLQDYGAWLATGNILVWITAVDPGLSAVLQQKVAVAYGRRDLPEIGRLAVSGITLGLLLSLLPVLLAFGLADHLPSWLRLTSEVNAPVLVKAFLLAGFGTTLAVMSFALASVNQGLLSGVGIGVIYVVVHSLDILITILLLHRGWGVTAIAFSFVMRGGGLMLGHAGYLLWRIRKENIPLSFSLAGIKSLSNVLSFTFFSKAGILIVSNMESFLVARLVGAGQVPLLALTRKSLDIGRIVVERPPLAFMPAISHLVGAGEMGKVREYLLRLFRVLLWLAGLIVGGVLVFNDDFVGLWVGRELFAGKWVNAVLCLNFLLVALHSSLSNLALSLGDIKRNSLVSLAQSLIYVAAAVALGKAYGILGIAAAMAVSLLLTSAWYYPISVSSIISLPGSDVKSLAREAVLILALSAAAAAAVSVLPASGLSGFLGFTLLFAAVYAAGLWVFSPGFRAEAAKFSKLCRPTSAAEAS